MNSNNQKPEVRDLVKTLYKILSTKFLKVQPFELHFDQYSEAESVII